MIRKFAISFLVYVVFVNAAFLMESCHKTCDTKTSQTTLSSITSKLQRITGASSGMLDRHDLPAASQIRFDSLAIDLQHVILTHAKIDATGSVTGSAFACDFNVIYQTLSDISIISSGTFDAEHPSGTNLKDVVRFHVGYSQSGVSDDRFISDQNQVGSVPFLLSFGVPPAENSLHNFTITYSLSDGTSVQTSVGPVWITK
jgi:hypothetical protein